MKRPLTLAAGMTAGALVLAACSSGGSASSTSSTSFGRQRGQDDHLVARRFGHPGRPAHLPARTPSTPRPAPR